MRLKSRPISQNKTENKRRRKALKILSAVTLLFLISWLPLTLFTLLSEYYPNLLTSVESHHRNIYGLMCLLGGSNSIANPILYGYMNENFKKEYAQFFKKLPWYRNTLARKNAFRRKSKLSKTGTGNQDQMKMVKVPTTILRRLSSTELFNMKSAATISLNFEYNQTRNPYKRK